MARHLIPVAALLALVGACGRATEPPSADAPEDQLVRARAAACFTDGAYGAARVELQPLVDRPRPAVGDLVRAAIVERELGEVEVALELLERARKLAPDDAAVNYNVGVIHESHGRFEAAFGPLERAHAAAPDDYPTRLHLANTIVELALDDGENAELLAEARAHYDALYAIGPNFAGGWHTSVTHRLARLERDRADFDAVIAYTNEAVELEGRGIQAPDNAEILRGNFGRIDPPAPDGSLRRLAPRAPSPSATPLLDVSVPGARSLAVLPLPRVGESGAGASALLHVAGAPSLLAWGPGGAWRIAPDGAVERLASRPIEFASVDDLVDRVVENPLQGGPALEHDGDQDYWLVGGRRLEVLRATPDGLESLAGLDVELPGPPRDVAFVDYDHDGDLDVAAVGTFGARLLRNDGVGVEGGSLVDVTDEAGLPTAGSYAWIAAEDFDTDQDVDLLLGGPSGAFLADNLRGGRFADESGRAAALGPVEDEPATADFDADGLPDLWCPAPGPRLLIGLASGGWDAGRESPGAAPPSGAALRVEDLDLDGAPDVLWSDPDGALRGRLALGAPDEGALVLPGLGGTALRVCDLDGDCVPELVRVDGETLEARSVALPDRTGLQLGLAGGRDNATAVGATLELRAGTTYRRIRWDGEPRFVGLGGNAQVDVTRVVWPNGVQQYAKDLAPCAGRVIEQTEGLGGSCPFLYTWNGEEFEYITDVLGITPLGLPMAPGVLVPPDHDEFVLVRGDQLVPRDGAYELQITEELREVTYLDRVRLDVVDHPADSEVWPDERFCFPPFPAPHIHTTRRPTGPTRALGSDGADWAAELGAVDGSFAVPFRAWRGALRGLTHEHALELEFDPESVASADRLRLVMTGWFLWTNASVNVAAARTPGAEFLPPVLQVPDPTSPSGWRDAGPPIGFPAGKTKTMVVDVTDLLDPGDPRLRLRSTLRLYWDAIRLATDADDAPVEVRSLEPSSAELWERGFSEPFLLHPEHDLEWFRWDSVADEPRWDQHPGSYTAYGDVLRWLGDVDDRFVVMGAGDALTLRFDARALPPVRPGWRRDYLLYLDGWAKDRDPNTLEALGVEPLPFHAMSGYPYGPEERFPDGELHREWRRESLTRPARRWSPILSSRRPPPGS